MITKVFKSGNSHAIRIPACIQIHDGEVQIEDLGKKGILITPLPKKKDPWELFQEGISELKGEWKSCKSPKDQKREDW